MATNEQVMEALKKVEDPELGIDIVTTELIRGVDVNGSTVTITMTLTSPQCPYGPMIMDHAKNEVKNIDDVEEAIIELTFSPPWEPSAELRAILGV